MIDILLQKIIDTNNPTTVGIDTALDYLPIEMQSKVIDYKSAAKQILIFNKNIIDSIADIAPSVKVQIAYYEMYSYYGMETFYKTLAYAKDKGLVVISDAKRNDIGSTASCYSKAFLGNSLKQESESAFPSHFLTINGYLGYDGIEPFLTDMKNNKKGGFVLVKTSNPSSDELQDLILENGLTIYEHMGNLVTEWGKDLIGKFGYSSLGAVVGATKKEQAKKLRESMKACMFLVPGYGVQGGNANDIMVSFDNKGLGAIVNNSRGILCAYKKEKYNNLNYYNAARQATLYMKEDLLNSLQNVKGIDKIG